MKVCYVLSTSEITGGANRSILDLLGSIDKDLIEPVVLIKKHGDIEEALKELNIPYFLVPFINEVSTGNVFLDGVKRLNAIKTTKQIESFLREQKIDLVHNNSLPALAGMEAANKLHVPYVCHIREQVESGLGLQLLNKKKHFEIVKNATTILAISNFVCKEYVSSLGAKDIIVIQDGVDISLYLNEEKCIFVEKEIHIGIYGNLDPQKGQLDAVKAVEILQNKGISNVVLHIIGNQKTSYAETVRHYVTEKKIQNIMFMEPIKDIVELKKSRAMMDINLVCSSAEGLGRVTVESMLSGCLTIGADAGATPEIISEHETGLLYACHNVEELANQIEWAMMNCSEAQEIARQGRNFAKKKYDINEYAKHVQEIYQIIISSEKEE